MLNIKYIYFYVKFSTKCYLSINVNCIRPVKKNKNKLFMVPLYYKLLINNILFKFEVKKLLFQ